MKHLLVLLLVGCGAPKAAPVAPATPLVGEMQKLQWYVGDWACEGTVFGSKDAPESKWQATVNVRGDAAGGVVAIHMLGPGDNSTAEIKGYDNETKRWYHFWSTRDGQHGSMTATGWEGEKLVAVDDKDPKIRTVMTKLGADKYSHGEEAMEGEAWKPTWTKVCSRK